MKRFPNALLGRLPLMFRKWGLVLVAVLAGGLLFVSDASASVTHTLLTGSTGDMTISLSSVIFNNDPSALPLGTCTTTLGRGCNSDVASGTSLTFIGGPLTTGEGLYINNNDLTLSAPSAADANSFLTFASHPNLVFSMDWPPGPGSANTNCATANANGLSCSIFAGSPIILTYANGDTFLGLSVHGDASDTGVGGLAAGTEYTGGFSEFFTSTLPNGMAPTPANIQLYFCPSGTCMAADFTSGKSIFSSQSGTFTAIPDSNVPPVPEPSTMVLSSLGMIMMLLLGTGLLKSGGARA